MGKDDDFLASLAVRPKEAAMNAADFAVRNSLQVAGVLATVTSGQDSGGLFLAVEVPRESAEAARRWQAAYGRSHGCVRIFVREAS
jgi:hypothetical protein